MNLLHLIIKLFFVVILLLSIISCTKPICTKELFVSEVTVSGDSLTDFYTIRNSNSDTIKFTTGKGSYLGRLPVLSDNYYDILKGIPPEDFKFIGIINDVIVFNEPFVYSADECHIVKVSGKEEIKL